MHAVINRGTLWTLTNGRKTATAAVREIQGVSLELRYVWDGELMQSHLFRDGTELLKDADTKRLQLEKWGWQLVPLAQQ
jgi:hypothetical protein